MEQVRIEKLKNGFLVSVDYGSLAGKYYCKDIFEVHQKIDEVLNGS